MRTSDSVGEIFSGGSSHEQRAVAEAVERPETESSGRTCPETGCDGRVVTNAAALLGVRGDVDTVVAAATYVDDHGFTPFDALHLVESDGDTIVSSDDTYESFGPRLDLTAVDDE